MRLPKLTGDRINLRRLTRSDAEEFQPLANDPRVAEYLPRLPKPYTRDEARKWVNKTHRDARRDAEYHFGIENPATGQIVGMVSLRALNFVDGNAELGYWVARKYWQRGFGSEAVRLILALAFQQLQLHRVYALVAKSNTASIRLLEKSGFMREGVSREVWRHEGKLEDIYSFGLLRPEYGAAEPPVST